MHNSPSGSGARPVSWLALHRTAAAFPGNSPVALCIPAVALCAYSYGVVADSRRASRHLAVCERLQAERLSSRMKLRCEILQCINRLGAGHGDPVILVIGAM